MRVPNTNGQNAVYVQLYRNKSNASTTLERDVCTQHTRCDQNVYTCVLCLQIIRFQTDFLYEFRLVYEGRAQIRSNEIRPH